ncbi:MAG: GAF domain-containing protein [Chloroflexi bacterium]|nr:GAF domain-containing protein [Chloroflexota bacterium]MBI3339672.1 GAF domain-containing protein [Chloroflexota bacterium]
MVDNNETQLKEACQLTGALWAVIAEREGGHWLLQSVSNLNKTKQTALTKFLAQETVDAWLLGASEGENSRSASLSDSKLGAARLYVYPISNSFRAILVAADQQTANAQRIWRLMAGLFQSLPSVVAPSEILIPGLQTDLPYDMPRVLERVLTSFVHAVNPQGAWLAIRRGDTLDISAQWNDPRGDGLSLLIDSNNMLRRLHRTLADVSVSKGQPEWDNLPHATRKSNTKFWVCLPLVIGRRLIGAIALWSQAEFSADEWQKLRELARQASPSVEVIVTFNELTGHLRRLAMLNDFAVTVSSAQNLDQIARRVFGLLTRSFRTELIALYLPSMGGRLVREFSNRDGKFSAQSTSLADHPILPYLQNGRTLRLSDLSNSDFKPVYSGARSGLMVPLKYRGQTIGILSLESTRQDAFSQYDEHLMVVIASHLAGLVEYGRLREEAEARARNLGLIHEVVQQVIGLSDKREMAQITADLLAEYFAYELAGVMLIGDDSASPILGFGGSRRSLVQRALGSEDFVVSAGITGHVFYTGESVLVNDTSQNKLYKQLQGWDARSELCVALKDGGRILGIIDVESSQSNAFTNNDLLAIESLAGVLATVVSSADQYQRLQETVHQLRAAQVELRARMTAQQDAESRLIQAAKLAAVGEMAAGIAHELNNPLTTVTGFTELLLEETPDDAPHRADIQMVLHEAHRARGVVRRLLDFARQGERIRSKSDINEIVEDVLALTKHLIHTSGVRLNIWLGKELPWASVDSNQMKQVFLNLIHNALQAMPSGGNLDIQTVTRERGNRSWVTVSIKDSGIGIDPQNKERIFEPFFTTKGNTGGTGLGLSVTYGIVTDHGGTIEVESRPGLGSTFTVWLPI